MKRSPRQGKPFEVSPSLHARLNMYALAASSAGVGVLALAQPAQAKVVYTPAHQIIGANGVYNLDLNQDGTVDFLIQQWNYGNWASNNQLLADPAVGNAVLGSKFRAAALTAGASIGPNQNFIAGASNGEVMLSITHFTTGGTSFVHGSWANVRNRYLGLKFQIAGETHYGWARLSVQRQRFHFIATLTGYAFEDIANTPIIAGETSGEAADSTTSPASLSPDTRDAGASVVNSSDTPRSDTPRHRSLGELALGALSVPVRRQP
jgi:hypothetical protein